MRIYAIAVFLFLYVPIGIIVLFSFNAGRHASELRGLSVQWYGKALSNPFVADAFFNSLIEFGRIASVSVIHLQWDMRTSLPFLSWLLRRQFRRGRRRQNFD